MAENENPYLKGLDPMMTTQQLTQTIETLRTQRSDLDQAITALEKLRTHRPPGAPSPSKRGRKSMGAAEREEVSRRMRRYWSERRKRTDRAAKMADAVFDHFNAVTDGRKPAA